MTAKKTVSLDLDSLDTVAACDKGAEIQLNHPVTKLPIDIYVTVLGKESTVFRSYVKETANARVRADALATKRGKDTVIPTVEDADERAIELLLLCMVGWRQADGEGFKNSITYKSNELLFNVPNAKLMLETFPWFRLQVDTAIGDLENFI